MMPVRCEGDAMLDSDAIACLGAKLQTAMRRIGIAAPLSGAGTWVIGDTCGNGSRWEIFMTCQQPEGLPRITVAVYCFFAMHPDRSGGAAFIGSRSFPSAEDVSEAWLETMLRSAWEEIHRQMQPARWAMVGRMLGTALTGKLIGRSEASVRAYCSRKRTPPPAVAARLDFLAEVVTHLSLSYTDGGVRQWFFRERMHLKGSAPASFLVGEWSPADPGPQRILALAIASRDMGAT